MLVTVLRTMCAIPQMSTLLYYQALMLGPIMLIGRPVPLVARRCAGSAAEVVTARGCRCQQPA